MLNEDLCVKNLKCCASLAYVDQIVTEKTGTLTQRKMAVGALHFEGSLRFEGRLSMSS